MGDSRIADRRLFGRGHSEQACAEARFFMGLIHDRHLDVLAAVPALYSFGHCAIGT